MVARAVRRAKLVRNIQPDYPVAARPFGIGGTVALVARVGVDGRVIGFRGVTGHPMLVPKVLETVRGGRYEPAEINGRQVQIEVPVVITFRKES